MKKFLSIGLLIVVFFSIAAIAAEKNADEKPMTACKEVINEKGCNVVNCPGKAEETIECPSAPAPTPIECKTYVDEKECKVTTCSDGSGTINCPTITETISECKKYIDEKGCTVKSCPNQKEEIYCPTKTIDCKKSVDEKGCNTKECTDGTYERYCPNEPKPKEIECKSYLDDAGCEVITCNEGTQQIKCPNQKIECEKSIDELGCTITTCPNGKVDKYCPKTNPETKCKILYSDDDVKCKNGAFTVRGCVEIVGTVTFCPEEEEKEKCKYYFDEKNCKVKSCEDGTTEIDCPNKKKCEDIKCKEGTVCIDAECVVECKTIELGNNCILKKCTDGYNATTCLEGTGPQKECKAFQKEDGCIAKICADGTETKICPQVEKKENIECKKYKDKKTGCTTKKCTDGYEATDCGGKNVKIKPTGYTGTVMITGGSTLSSTNIVTISSSMPLEYFLSDNYNKGAEKKILVSKNENGSKIKIKSGEVEAETTQEIELKEKKLLIENSEVKILPDTASAKAKETVSKLEVKKIAIKKENGKVNYAIEGTKKGNLLFIIPVELEVSTTIDAETGTITKTEKPWWEFLVS